ncbi:hypothetical protein M1O51_02755 [Dehalococcoidia bacterium]|nr:hypothetical protein [Dehalococcoidia bacterium]
MKMTSYFAASVMARRSFNTTQIRICFISNLIEIEDAGTFIDLSRLEVLALPIANLIFSERVPVEA